MENSAASLDAASLDAASLDAASIDAARAELAPDGVLRAAINMGNGLLVTGRTPSGEPDGVAPDMARALAAFLGVSVELCPFARPDEAAAAAASRACAVCLVGAEPARAKEVAFTAAYAEIEATYLVQPGSPLERIEDVDRAGIRIAVSAGSAYGHWLDRNVTGAELVRTPDAKTAADLFAAGGADALAALKTQLLGLLPAIPGARILPGRFTAVQQAIGTWHGNAAAAVLRPWAEHAKASGLVARLIEKHRPVGLSVAPPDGP